MALQAHRLYGTSVFMDDISTVHSVVENEEKDFFTQTFEAHHTNSSSSISQEAYIRKDDQNDPFSKGFFIVFFQLIMEICC